MNILISNVYSWQNKGDAAIIISMIDHLKLLYPYASISISSQDMDDNSEYAENALFSSIINVFNSYTNPHDHYIIQLIKKKCIMILLELFGCCRSFNKKPFWLLPHVLREKVKSYKTFDLVVACGGGYITTKHRKRLSARLLNIDLLEIFCMDFYIAYFFNIPYLLYNQSIGPFYSNKDLNRYKKYLNRAKVIVLREEISYQLLKKNDIKNIVLSDDIAFDLLPKKIKLPFSKASDKIIIGMTLRNYLTPPEKQLNFEKEVAVFIDNIINNDRNIYIYFVPQVRCGSQDDDRKVVTKIINRLDDRNKYNIILDDNDYTPNELKYIISNVNYFIGNRMHSCIFALASKIPTISIAYEYKSRGIMKKMNLENYVIDMDKLTTDSLQNLFTFLQQDLNYIDILERGLKNIEKNNKIDITQWI